MIFGLLRLAVVGFVLMTIVYIALSIYSRSVYREELEKEWLEKGGEGDRDAFVEAGMRDYETSLRRKLIWLVYIIPTALVLVMLYVINFM